MLASKSKLDQTRRPKIQSSGSYRALKMGLLHPSIIYNQENGQKIGALRTKDSPENHHFRFFCLIGKKTDDAENRNFIRLERKSNVWSRPTATQMFGRDQQRHLVSFPLIVFTFYDRSNILLRTFCNKMSFDLASVASVAKQTISRLIFVDRTQTLASKHDWHTRVGNHCLLLITC